MDAVAGTVQGGINMVSANLKDWKEATKGIYRYVISANAAYEIHINY